MNPPAPVINVGKYAGTEIDKLPEPYLRWMVGQDFPKEWLDIVMKILRAYDDPHSIFVTRHAIDRYSQRFLYRWIQDCNECGLLDGLATYVTKKAEQAWEKGRNVSKYRYAKDGVIKEWEDVHFVFVVNRNFPEYKELITVMEP